MKRAPTWDILGLFLATRLLLMLVTYLGYILLTQDKYAGTPVALNTFFASWNQWDATRYTHIAQFGYQINAHDLAFFPLFPLLIAIFTYPFGAGSYLIVGMLVSNIALLGTLFVLYQLAQDMGGEQVARRTLLYLCVFPTAFFFFAAYNETLFLLLTTSTFLALRRQNWWLAGLLGFLAALTRSAGVLLVIPYLYELWATHENIHEIWRHHLNRLLPILIIPCGTILYCFFCWQKSGDPLAFMTLQINWSRHFAFPWTGIWQSLFELFWLQPFGSFNEIHVLFDLSATLAFIALAIVGRRKLRVSYSLWTFVLLLSMLISPTLGQPDPLISNQRFVLEIFPVFITLAMLGIKHPRFHQALIWIFPALLATTSLIFVMGRWMV